MTQHNVLPGVEVKQEAWDEDTVAHRAGPEDRKDLSDAKNVCRNRNCRNVYATILKRITYHKLYKNHRKVQ